ncbi:hypothetical protein BGX38DRAFT_1264300 [Terfezia claveryi]|nr:hypothetical protein BGX38DRAFT_1264300 [Terfezia claveryi]
MPPGGFRRAYTTQGVSTYYTANSHTYRNPHFPGVVKCIHAILNHLILPPRSILPVTYNLNEVVIEKDTGERVEIPLLDVQEDEKGEAAELTVFDCAAGGGEATVAVREWVGRVMPELLWCGSEGETGGGQGEDEKGKMKRRKLGLRVYASDPFTNELYEERVNGFRKSEGIQDGARGYEANVEVAGKGVGSGDGEQTEAAMGQKETPLSVRGDTLSKLIGSSPIPTEPTTAVTVAQTQLEPSPTQLSSILCSTPSTLPPSASPPNLYIPCHSFSFRDIPFQGLDTLLSAAPGVPLPTGDPPSLYIDLTIISFALHLCPPSELFSLLYELSRHSAYLVVIAPHKNPHIPGGGESGWVGPLMEVLVKKERVRGRVFRSVNF